LGGGKGFSFGKHLSINGTITGGLRGTKFTARGAASLDFKFGSHKVAAGGTVSNTGRTTCAALPQLASGNSGATYCWDGSITIYQGQLPVLTTPRARAVTQPRAFVDRGAAVLAPSKWVVVASIATGLTDDHRLARGAPWTRSAECGSATNR
jgi:hypothetical protein